MTQLEETLIAMWSTMQGMVTPQTVFAKMASHHQEKIYKFLGQVYTHPEMNVLLLRPLAFAEMKIEDFWKMLYPEKEFPQTFVNFQADYAETARFYILWRNFLTDEILIRAKKQGEKQLFYTSFHCFYVQEEAPEKITQLLKYLNECPYSYQVYQAFCLLIFQNHLIAEKDVPLLVSAFEKHKKGLEARGKCWLKKTYF